MTLVTVDLGGIIAASGVVATNTMGIGALAAAPGLLPPVPARPPVPVTLRLQQLPGPA